MLTKAVMPPFGGKLKSKPGLSLHRPKNNKCYTIPPRWSPPTNQTPLQLDFTPPIAALPALIPRPVGFEAEVTPVGFEADVTTISQSGKRRASVSPVLYHDLNNDVSSISDTSSLSGWKSFYSKDEAMLARVERLHPDAKVEFEKKFRPYLEDDEDEMVVLATAVLADLELGTLDAHAQALPETDPAQNQEGIDDDDPETQFGMRETDEES